MPVGVGGTPPFGGDAGATLDCAAAIALAWCSAHDMVGDGASHDVASFDADDEATLCSAGDDAAAGGADDDDTTPFGAGNIVISTSAGSVASLYAAASSPGNSSTLAKQPCGKTEYRALRVSDKN